jgi:hypothetical protein
MIEGAQGGWFWLITMLCRPLVLICGTKKLRQSFTSITRTVYQNNGAVAFVIATLFLSIWVFIWMGMVLFARTPEGRKDFFSWADGCASMWILFTTANDPNDWIPAYTSYKISVFFFIIFLVLMLYLLLNLLLANVYQGYKQLMEDDLSEVEGIMKINIGKAFLYLADDNNDIPPKAWEMFIKEYCDPYIGNIQAGDPTQSQHNTARSWKVLKPVFPRAFKGSQLTDPIGYPLFEELMRIMTTRQIFIPSPGAKEAVYTSYLPSLEKLFKEGIEVPFDVPSEICGFQVRSEEKADERPKIPWDRMIDFIILIDMPFTFWASVSFAATKTAQNYSSFTSFQLLFAVSVIYTLGISVKILSLGWERFWWDEKKKTQHRFDFFNVYLLIIAEFTYFCIWPAQMLARVIILLHLFRGFRLLAYFDDLRGLYNMVALLVPTFWQLFLVLFCVYYIFAIIGQYLFGGKIFTTNPVLANTNFSSAGFWPLNFNDLPSGFVTLFALMIVNNWYEIAQGFMLATNSNLISIYFVIFFVIVNLVVLNIVMAVIIDCNSAMEGLLQSGAGDADLEQGEGMGTPSAEYVMRRALNMDPSTPPTSDDEPLPTPSRKERRMATKELRSQQEDLQKLAERLTPKGADAPLLSESAPAETSYSTFSDPKAIKKSVTLKSPILSPQNRSDDEADGA